MGRRIGKAHHDIHYNQGGVVAHPAVDTRQRLPTCFVPRSNTVAHRSCATFLLGTRYDEGSQ
jgi:hypothetical protein